MRSLDEIYELLGTQPFSAEFKYDGQRAQIHAARRSQGSNDVKIFSRHLEDMTDKVFGVPSRGITLSIQYLICMIHSLAML